MYLVLLLLISLLQINTTELYSEWDTVLSNHVKDGLVNYKALKSEPENLNLFLEKAATVSETEFKNWGESEQLAFYINLYNALTIKLILNEYPVKSIKDIGNIFKGPWSREVFTLFGEKITLNNLEHDIIRKQFKEPRIHVALVCAAKGCPPLRSESYRGEKLALQLEKQTELYLKSSKGLVMDEENKTIFISSIFKWYEEDFDSVHQFIQEYTPTNINDFSIRYLDYDWSLNEK